MMCLWARTCKRAAAERHFGWRLRADQEHLSCVEEQGQNYVLSLLCPLFILLNGESCRNQTLCPPKLPGHERSPSH